jgi:hypothetical protein
MIAFVTLLLGLISGSYPIEVKVGGPVVAVEYTLDGAAAGRITAPPWSAKVNFGPDLRPHELVARALDARGNEIARRSQWINLPRPQAEVEIVLERNGDGVPVRAQLTWQSVSGVKPASISLTLDGQPLKVDDAGRAVLPARNLKSLHILTAELWFPPGVTAYRDTSYGGDYGSDVSTELTAIPVRLAPGGSLPPLDQLGGWFTAGGERVSAAAVEGGPAKITTVCLPTSTEILDRLNPGRKKAPAVLTLGSTTLGSAGMKLAPGDHLQYLSLSSIPFHAGRIPTELFQISMPVDSSDGGMFDVLTSKRWISKSLAKRPLRVADAVAVAGLQAVAENHRRAVLLILGKEVADASRYDPATVRRYLAAVHVPLVVWSLYGPDTALAKAWGPVEDISSLARLGEAVTRLRGELDRQQIVWLDGRHLPQDIALTPAATAAGLALVAAP